MQNNSQILFCIFNDIDERVFFIAKIPHTANLSSFYSIMIFSQIT